MSLKSHIDWNEIIPLLPRAKREELYLEAVTLLSQEDREKDRQARKSVPVVAMGAPAKKSHDPNKRIWERDGDGSVLSRTGRKYRIKKDSKVKFRGGAIKEVWELIKSSHNDTITYEGLASIWEGIRRKHESDQPLSTIIGNLYARGAIDVVPVAQAE